jgi:kynurenine 3-monooxygenase
MPENRIVIVGAGLAGSLLAIYMARRRVGVDVYEARGDMRKEAVAAGRSINLALSDRGIAALREVGMDDYMLAEAVPMHGRMIHSSTGELKLLRYSGRSGEYINSVSRAGLNAALMTEAEKYPEVTMHFGEKCVDVDCDSGTVRFGSGLETAADAVFAADGAGSAVRQAIERQVRSFSAQSVFLDHGYKELHIPAKDGEFQLEKNALHIWPRHQFMMIALPNFDGSFTCTLFLAHHANGEGSPAFDNLRTETDVTRFFEREFPDAVPLMPELIQDFFANPTGDLGRLRCSPWNTGKCLLLGDAAHAMVPFYGQGMNCAFEDVRLLDELSDETGCDWGSIFSRYEGLRKADADAIQDMAEENFYEMRDATADPVFQRKRELETKLEHTYPDYFSKYSMVTFREDLPYSVAKRQGGAQDRLLMELCAGVSSVAELDMEAVMAKLRQI